MSHGENARRRSRLICLEEYRNTNPRPAGEYGLWQPEPWSQPVRGRFESGDDEVTQKTESEQSRSPVFQFIFLQIPRSSRYFVTNLSEGPPVQLSGCTGEYAPPSDVVKSLGTGSPSSRWLGDLCSPVTTPPLAYAVFASGSSRMRILASSPAFPGT
jgi:hypothetical protein